MLAIMSGSALTRKTMIPLQYQPPGGIGLSTAIATEAMISSATQVSQKISSKADEAMKLIKKNKKTIICAAAGGAAAIVLAPVVIGAAGFTSGGIAAGSLGAKMMSTMAVGGVTSAGGTVATLQSIGAAGMGAMSTTVVGTAGAFVGATIEGIHKHLTNGKTEKEDEEEEENITNDPKNDNSIIQENISSFQVVH